MVNLIKHCITVSSILAPPLCSLTCFALFAFSLPVLVLIVFIISVATWLLGILVIWEEGSRKKCKLDNKVKLVRRGQQIHDKHSQLIENEVYYADSFSGYVR